MSEPQGKIIGYVSEQLGTCLNSLTEIALANTSDDEAAYVLLMQIVMFVLKRELLEEPEVVDGVNEHLRPIGWQLVRCQ